MSSEGPTESRHFLAVRDIKQEPGCSQPTTNLFEHLANTDIEMDSTISFNTPYKIKDPIILLERCDKIWETMQLIKTMQSGLQDQHESTPSSPSFSNKNTKSITVPSEQYIRYQPVLSNGNEALPNFHLSVKRTKKIYQCKSCDRQFAENRSLRKHSFRVHGIFIPARFRRKVVKKVEGENTESANSLDSSVVNKEKEKSVNDNSKNITKEVKERSTKSVDLETSAFSIHSESSLASPYHTRKMNSLGHTMDEKDAETTTNRKSNKYGYVSCPLCRRSVKCTTTHMIKYHKISRPDLIIGGLRRNVMEEENDMKVAGKHEIKEQTSEEASASEERENNFHISRSQKRPNSSTPYAAAKRQRVDDPESEQANASSKRFIEKVQCKRCLRSYSSSNFPQHACSPETENNVDATKSESDDVSQGDATPDNSFRRSNRVKRTCRILVEATRIFCDCGRSFRTSQYMLQHKRSCKTKEEEKDAKRHNGSDRDSGIGISITIKKKNDSYEIVGKDSGDENRSKDCDISLDSSDVLLTGFGNDRLNASDELAKYSENHSVILVKNIDEDVNVEIEEDSQHGFSTDTNDNVRSSSMESIKMSLEDKPVECTESLKDNTLNRSKMMKTVESTRTVPSLKLLCEKALGNRDVANNRNVLACSVCEKTFGNENELLRHAPRCTQEPRQTCICGRTFSRSRHLHVHAKRVHPLVSACPYCSETFKDMSAYIEHHCDTVGSFQYRKPSCKINCPYCNVVLDNTKQFDEHIKFKHFDPILPYQCHRCLKRFLNSQQRHLHFRHEHTAESYYCELCNVRYTSSIGQKHEFYHQGLGYPCHRCKRAYAKKTTLLRHNRMHNRTGANLVTCNVCKKTFVARTFRKHLNVHTRYATCELCGKPFAGEVSLEDHIMKNHRETYPRISCNSCGMFFTTKYAMQRHVQTEECYKYSRHTMEDEMLCDI